MAGAIGRPTRCTPELTEKFCDAVRLGCAYVHCCGIVGIDQATFKRWRVHGEDGIEPYRAFCAAVDQAEADGVQARMAVIHSHAAKDWRAAAWVQEARHPENYARRRVEVTGADGAPVQVAAQVVLVPAIAPTSATWAETAAAQAAAIKAERDKQ